jgi:hypothetical protein
MGKTAVSEYSDSKQNGKPKQCYDYKDLFHGSPGVFEV